jgi:putative transposase
MAALIDGDLAGFATRLPEDLPGEPPLIVGIGPVATLDGLAPGYTLASRALRTATALAMPGLWTLPALGLLPAVLDDDEVGAPLVEAIVDRVRATGSGPVLLDTVACYLANDRRLDVTARDLHVHVNTVRYRLRQFAALTDRNLARTADLVAVWWALRPAGAAT